VRIIAAWVILSADEREAVWSHLNRMATEDGWADVQRQSAQAAIRAIASAADDAPPQPGEQNG
jgi:predicted Fe-S protein YdhL (DUF1289 family)